MYSQLLVVHQDEIFPELEHSAFHLHFRYGTDILKELNQESALIVHEDKCICKGL